MTTESHAAEKPSERINARTTEGKQALTQYLRAACDQALQPKAGRALLDQEFAAFLASSEGLEISEMSASIACLGAIIEELDREAERRAEWEKRVEAFARDDGVEI